MKIAAALFKNALTPRLDITDSLIIYNINNGSIIEKEKMNIDFNIPGQLILQLKKEKVQIIL